MIEFLVDQNFNEDILNGLTRRDATLVWSHVRETNLDAASDETVLEWATAHGVVLVTHDRTTIPPIAYARIAAGLPMPGVFLVSNLMPISQAIEELLIAVHCLSADECKNLVRYFPL